MAKKKQQSHDPSPASLTPSGPTDGQTTNAEVLPKKKADLIAPVVLDKSAAVTLQSEGNLSMSVLPALALVPQLVPFKSRADDIEAMEGRANINSEDAYQRGSDFASICANNWDQLEALRKAVKGPVDDYAKFIQSLFVPIQVRFASAKSKMLTKMLAFHQAEEKRRAEEAARIKAENDAAMLKLAEEQEKKGDSAGAAAILDAAVQAPVPMPSARIGGSNSFGATTVIPKRWTGTVEKPFEVLAAIISGKYPIDCIEWSQVNLNAAAKKIGVEGTFNGLKVEHKASMQVR